MNCPNCHQPFDKPPGGQIPYRCPHCQSTVLGVYCDLTQIGGGAMGDVYRGQRPDMGRRTVAIKIPKQAEPRVCSRFEREIAASSRLRHENIVCAFDRGEEEGRPYLVMEYVAGQVLSDLVDLEHPLPVAEAARIVRQVAAGLAHAAQHRIVNRDIKPDNVLISIDGTAKILDYGLALIAELDGSSDRVTRNGTLLGTPGFLAPEQARDPRGVDIAADVYALGCTAYYILTRRPPFTGKDSFAIVEQHANAPRPSVRVKRPDVDARFDGLIQRMMAVEPSKRPSPREIVQELDRMMPELNTSRPSLPGSTSGTLDVRCPGCQEVYHLKADMVGKVMKCRNALCGQRFMIEPQLGATVSYAEQRESAQSVPVTRDGMGAMFFQREQHEVADGAASAESEPLEAEAVEAEPLEAEALEAEPVGDEIAEAEPLEAEPVEAEALEAEPAEVEALDAEPVDAEPVEPIEVAVAVAPETSPEGEVEIGTAEIAEAELATPPIAEDQPPPPVYYTPGSPAVEASPGAIEMLPASPVNPEPPPLVPEVPETIGLVPPPSILPAPSDVPPTASAWPAAPASQEPAATTTATPATTARSTPVKQKAPRQPRSKPAKQKAPRQPLTKAQQRKRRVRMIGLGSIAVMAVAGLALWYFWPKPLTPDERWAEAQKLYKEDRQWGRATKEFNKFVEDFPENEHVPEVPYFVAMCEVGDLIHSDAYFGRRDQALAAARKIFDEHRDSPAYNAYCSDLFEALKTLVGHFLKEAEAISPPGQTTLAKLDLARETHELLKTVSEGVKSEQAPSEILALDQQIAAAQEKVQKELTRQEAVSLLTGAKSAKEPIQDIDGLYAKVDQMLTSVGPLTEQQQREMETLKREAWLAEKDRVRYVPQDESAVPVAAAGSAGNTSPDLFVIWDGRQDATDIERDKVLTALSRGVLYVFDPQGNFLWARRLGVDSYRLPLHVPATATSPAALIVVSTEDNTLLSLDAFTGKVLWQFKAGGDITSPLTIVSVPAGRNQPEKLRGLLPTTDGTTGYIHVLELVLGKPLGRFEIAHPLANVGGGYDPNNRLVYFPADSQRIFAINPLAIDSAGAVPPCTAVLYTGHASGALRSEPVIVDRGTPEAPEAYMILAEAADLEHMRLRVFDLTQSKLANPRSEPIHEVTLNGWSWFSPLAAPDRLTVVTDAGELGVFGINLDDSREALYKIIADDSTRLSIRDSFRSLAADSDERYLWAMAGGALRKLKMDVLGQRVHQLWPKGDSLATVTGVPLHEAQLDARGDHLFLSLMSADGGHFDFVAVDSHSGQKAWQRQLGMKLFRDPITYGSDVLLIDHSGRTVLLNPESDQTVYEPPGETMLPDGGDPRRLMQIADDAGRQYLALPLEDGRRLALASLDAAGDSAVDWQYIPLPERLQGQPCICGDFLIAGSADGLLNRVPLRPGVQVPLNEQPIYWMPGNNKAPGPEPVQVHALGTDTVLLTAARRNIRRMQIREVNNVTSWQQVGGSFESDAPLVGQVQVLGDQAFVADEAGTVYAFRLADPGKELGRWNLGGRPTGELFLRGDKLLCVIDGRKLVAIDGQAQSSDLLWSTEPFRGRIRGQPVLDGDVLLVADEGRRVTAIQLADGQPAWFVRLQPRIGPAAAAVPFGKDRILVPLADGTLTVVNKPAANM